MIAIHKKIPFLFLIMIVGSFLQLPLAAQQIENPPDLDKFLAGKIKFNEIIDIVNKYYDKAIGALMPSDSITLRAIKRQQKMWNRWETYNYARLNPDGTLGNNNDYTQKAFELLEKQPQIRLQSATGSWQSLGPTNFNTTGGHNGGLGRVNCVAFHPQNANILYAGTANGGLWRREANGNWTALTDHLPSVSVSGVVVNYANANDIYILTGDGDSEGRQGMFSKGVYESHDGGNSWANSGQFPGITNLSIYNGYKLVQHPTNPAIFFACTSYGLYRTSDYCASWTQVGPTYIDDKGIVRPISITDFEFKPGDPSTIYASTNSNWTKFLKSTNGGMSFFSVPNPSMDAGQRLAIAVSPNQPNWVYVLSGPARGTGSFNGIFGSGNSGVNWNVNTTMPNILGNDINGQDSTHQTNYDLCIAVNPANATNIITGAIDCYTSINGGTTLTKQTHWNTKELIAGMDYIHADIHNLTYNGNRLYACTDGGLSYSDDHGVTWVNIWNGLNILQPYHIAGIEADANHWISGTQDNGTMYRNNAGFAVQHIGGGDGKSALIDPANVSNIYFTANETIYHSTNSGATSTKVTPPGADDNWPILTHNINSFSTILAGYGNGIFKYNPNTFLWSNRGASGYHALINCPSTSTRFYAAWRYKMYRSDDGGDSWVDLSLNSGFPTLPGAPDTLNISDLSVSPTNSGIVYLTLGGFSNGKKVFMSTNAGQTWTNVSGLLPNVATLSVAATSNGGAYIGNELGVFYIDNVLNVWQPFYNGLPKCPVKDLLINFTSGKIRAATFGRGIWESDLYNPCATNLSVSGEVRGSQYYEAGNSLTATQQAAGGVGTQLVYKSNNNITLTTGMEVKDAAKGTRFRAYLGPCGNGLQLLSMGSDSTMLYPFSIEELDTYKFKPINEHAYYTINGDFLEFFVPDYKAVAISKKNANGKLMPWVGETIFAKGFYRILANSTTSTDFEYIYNGIKVEKL